MEQNKINTYLQTQLQDSQNDLATLQEKKSNQVALLAELHFLLNLRTISYQAIHLCNILANATPLAVTLEKVTRTGNLVFIAGQADSDTQVTQFMKNIAQARKGKQPELASITTTQGANGDERHFQLKLPQD